MTTQDKNKLIAEFMGAKYSNYTDNTKGVILPNIGVIREGVKGLKYHTSWDWIIPVLAKCYEVNKEDDWDMWLNDALSTVNINLLFEKIVEFIQWYNENK